MMRRGYLGIWVPQVVSPCANALERGGSQAPFIFFSQNQSPRTSSHLHLRTFVPISSIFPAKTQALGPGNAESLREPALRLEQDNHHPCHQPSSCRSFSSGAFFLASLRCGVARPSLTPNSGLAWHTEEGTLRQKFEEFGPVEEAVRDYLFLPSLSVDNWWLVVAGPGLWSWSHRLGFPVVPLFCF